jgi:hypothetical protein
MIASIIESVYGFLSEEDLNLLDNLCTNFNIDNNNSHNTTPRKGNWYYRMIIDKETYFVDYQNTIKNYIYKKYKLNIEIKAIWINKVTSETNKEDKFHYDECDISIVSYINDNFEGGEFEYQKNETPPTEKIKPKRNLSLISNRLLPHKVSPVTSGERYSLIVFCDIPTKNKKTML